MDGNTRDFPEYLNGRPALITFWGLACGPCRREAPHLSALHEKYGEQLAVIAINAYGDERSSVDEYIQKEKLKHTILLDGKSVANQFHVTAYPTTYWIDRDGRVVDYEVGLIPPDRLEAIAEKLLK